jgi:putative ABC transport system ATP-binding protein
LDKFRGAHIGLVFQQNHFISSLNVVENLMIAQSLSNRKANSQSCLSLLDRLGLVHKAKQFTHNLSQGERQRVALARALVNDQILILADEPTSALDDVNCSSVINLIKDHSTNACLIIVTHDSRLKNIIPNQIHLAS